jgi:acyl carrier protein
MTREEIEETVTSIIRKEKELPRESLQPSTLLAEAGIDSLDALTILFAIEEHFKITISDEQSRAIRTFGDMIDTIEKLVPA